MRFSRSIAAALLVLTASPVLAQQTTSWSRSTASADEQVNEDPYGRSPAEVQKIALQVQQEYLETFSSYADIQLTEDMREPTGSSIKVDASKDPWRLVTQETMLANTSDPYFRVPNYSLAVNVDFNRDGTPDVARMYNNSKQGAIVVTYGGSEKREIVYKTDQPFANGQQIFAAGERIVLNFPEVRAIVITQVDGKPAAYGVGD